MSSYLFAANCLDPLQGLLDFTQDVKPFRTKIIHAGVALAFSDKITVSVLERLELEISQSFDFHTGNCHQHSATSNCLANGFETDVFDDSFGFEPTLRYSIITVPGASTTDTRGYIRADFAGYSAAGHPTFYVADECIPPEVPCPDGFEGAPFETASFDGIDAECLTNCGGLYTGPCSTPSSTICTDRSPTTLATSFTETLLIEDIDGNPLTQETRRNETTGVIDTQLIKNFQTVGSTALGVVYSYQPSATDSAIYELIPLSDNNRFIIGL